MRTEIYLYICIQFKNKNMTVNRSLSEKVMNTILAATAIVNKNTVEEEVNPFGGIDNGVELEFTPVCEFSSCGNTTQRSTTLYKNVGIMYDVIYSWNILKKPIDTFSIGLCLPMDTELKNGGYMFCYYEPEGFGLPNFRTLKDALDFIDVYTENLNK